MCWKSFSNPVTGIAATKNLHGITAYYLNIYLYVRYILKQSEKNGLDLKNWSSVLVNL